MLGKFIVVEGGEGAGKDTQIELLKECFGEEDYLFVKDPGSTDVGLALREMVLHNKAVSKKAELLMYLAARVQLVEEKILPALQEGKHVVTNRFDISTLAYQIYGRERLELLPLIKEMSTFACGDAIPDLLVYLDIPSELGLSRAQKSGELTDKFESEKVAFHERVREGYKKHLPEYTHVIIDAALPIEDVSTKVKQAITDCISEV